MRRAGGDGQPTAPSAAWRARKARVFTAATDEEGLRTLRLTAVDLIVKDATPVRDVPACIERARIRLAGRRPRGIEAPAKAARCTSRRSRRARANHIVGRCGTATRPVVRLALAP